MKTREHVWKLKIKPEQFLEQKASISFWQLTTLSRVVSALRFVQVPLLELPDQDTPSINRTRYNSFLFTCALLYEAMQLVERMTTCFRDDVEFDTGLRQLLKDPLTNRLRRSNLKSARNTLIFHFDESATGKQLSQQDLEPEFMSGLGDVNHQVHYELADLCAMGAFLGESLKATEALTDLIVETSALSSRFQTAAENLIASRLLSTGWRIEPEPSV